jgi:hypothetical protein
VFKRLWRCLRPVLSAYTAQGINHRPVSAAITNAAGRANLLNVGAIIGHKYSCPLPTAAYLRQRGNFNQEIQYNIKVQDVRRRPSNLPLNAKLHSDKAKVMSMVLWFH